jgi:thiamine biosynthesis lipoprotein
MGTQVTVLLPQEKRHLAKSVWQLFSSWEAALTRFRPDSELSRLNARAGEDVRVSPLLFQVVAAALEGARRTGGLYDPTILAALVRAGYDRDFTGWEDGGNRPSPASPPPATWQGWRRVRVDPATRTVRLPPGCSLDLGGLAKGMAVDAALELLRKEGAPLALVEAGGDLATSGPPPDTPGWVVALPTLASPSTITLHHGALATTGVGRRHWIQGDRWAHHLIDPRTGLPARSPLWAVTIAAPTCAWAEVAAKAAFLLGPGAGSAWLARYRLEGMFVSLSGVCRRTPGWPAYLGRPA